MVFLLRFHYYLVSGIRKIVPKVLRTHMRNVCVKWILRDLSHVLNMVKRHYLLWKVIRMIFHQVKDDKGTIRIRFDMEFDDGEEVHKSSKFETISVYCHEGQWWIGEGYSKKDREMGRRIMNFFNKLR